MSPSRAERLESGEGRRIDQYAERGAAAPPAILESQKTYNHPGARDVSGQRFNSPLPRSANPQRKAAPSPLQVSSTSTVEGAMYLAQEETISQSVPRGGAAFQHPPRSPRYNLALDLSQPKSPRDRLDELLATEETATREEPSRTKDSDAPGTMRVAPPKGMLYSTLRNVSSPLPSSNSTPGSPPRSPSTADPIKPSGSTVRPELRPLGRTSSLDSAISSISSVTTHSQKSSQDSFISTPGDIANLISTAGSPEAVIQHLLKEKQHLGTQNAQLWKLVDKQRALVLGLNKDLDRALKDKERYRKKLKEHLAPARPILSQTPPDDASETRESEPLPREASGSLNPSGPPYDLPIQGHMLFSEGLRESNATLGDSRTSSGRAKTPDIAPLTADVSRVVGEEQSTSCLLDSYEPNQMSKDSGSSNIISTASTSNDDRLTSTVRSPRITSAKILNQSEMESPSKVSPSVASAISTTSFTAKRSLPSPQNAPETPSLQAATSTPPGLDGKGVPLSRKAPPAPLNLRKLGRVSSHLHHYGPDDHSGSEYDDVLEVDEIPAFDRGRRKTREEDDRERDAAALREQETRSRSKRDKHSKGPTAPIISVASFKTEDFPSKEAPRPSQAKAIQPGFEPAAIPGYLSPPVSMASVLSPATALPASVTERVIFSPPPMSPGLPMSPRPSDRPLNSPLPRMPRDGIGASLASPPPSARGGFPGLPLSPRAPRQLIPLPPHTPISMASPGAPQSDDCHQVTITPPQGSKEGRPAPIGGYISVSETRGDDSSDHVRSNGIYRGFVSEAYPNLLLPPNALPSISIKVVSSRLKPSRLSVAPKGSEEEPVFTLGISARSDRQELWRLEKALVSLPQLDQQLKQYSSLGAKLPDRALFNGHAPAKIDARREALERYFEAILDTPMDEKAALLVCYYLSTQAIEPSSDEGSANTSIPPSGSPVTLGPEGRLRKEGYLTKRGKSFGGWKARFFVLDEPVLRYYESPGGPLLGTIKLQNAQIGKQSQHQKSRSPSRGLEDPDNQYRHAFLVLEPKRKDSSSLVRHVLCAESDEERDDWVEALLQYVDYNTSEDEKFRPYLGRVDSGGSSKMSIPQQRKRSEKKEGGVIGSLEFEAIGALQTVSYEDTVPGQAPVRVAPSRRLTDTPSPPATGNIPQGQANATQSSKTISGPTNATVIQDVGAWGNKPPTSPQTKDKEHKKRGIWGFRDKGTSDAVLAHPNESSTNLAQQQYNERTGTGRPVFGAPLAEAVKYYPPRGIDVCLPAVVYRCLEYLEGEDAASEEGIFRLSGSNVVIKALRERFNTEGDFDFRAEGQYYDVHAVASLLKMYLRELPSNVLPRELHLDFLAVQGMPSLFVRGLRDRQY